MKWTILNKIYRKITEIPDITEHHKVIYFKKPNGQWFLKNEEIILIQEKFDEITTIRATVIGSQKRENHIEIQCQINDKQTHINKREYPRDYCEYEAIITSVFGNNQGVILDISLKGAKLETDLDLLKEGDIIEIHFHMNEQLYSERAIVKWFRTENTRTYFGLEFYHTLKKAL